MDNKELMNKLQILANQYQKLEKENEGLKNQLEEERNNAEHLQACIKETVRIVNDTKESTIQANETIEEMKNLIDYYEKSVIKMFENIEAKVKMIVEKKEINQEDIKKMEEELSKTKEDLINLNKMIL